jgi:hypothetical protein
MRITVRSLVALAAFALVACDGGAAPPAPSSSGDAGTAPAVPIAQRFLATADAPGTKPDPVEKRETTDDLDGFIAYLAPHLFVDLDREETIGVLERAGFTWAASDVRFFGKTHQRRGPHLFGSIIEVQSEDGAKNVLDLLEADSKKPCPMSCAVRVSSFDVEGIPDGRGVHRLATAERIEAAGTEDEHPSDDYWVGFTEGSIVYTVRVQGLPGSVSEDQAQEIARAYYDRLTGN